MTALYVDPDTSVGRACLSTVNPLLPENQVIAPLVHVNVSVQLYDVPLVTLAVLARFIVTLLLIADVISASLPASQLIV
jgi:hypothetical protein